jgi:hypothetical protein
MSEFLKLCNLFSQDLIDRNVLVHKVSAFIGGNPDLMDWFKLFVGYEGDQVEVIENRPMPPTGRVSLSNCRGLGPSYRLLPRRVRTIFSYCLCYRVGYIFSLCISMLCLGHLLSWVQYCVVPASSPLVWCENFTLPHQLESCSNPTPRRAPPHILNQKLPTLVFSFLPPSCILNSLSNQCLPRKLSTKVIVMAWPIIPTPTTCICLMSSALRQTSGSLERSRIHLCAYEKPPDRR